MFLRKHKEGWTLDYVVRKIGERGASTSGYVEQVLREHLDRYKDDMETWRKP